MTLARRLGLFAGVLLAGLGCVEPGPPDPSPPILDASAADAGQDGDVPQQRAGAAALLGASPSERTAAASTAAIAAVPTAAPTAHAPIAPPWIPERASLDVEQTADGPSLRAHGFPAMRADGRLVVDFAWQEQADDVLVFLDTRTGRVRRSIVSPEHVERSEDGEIVRATVDRRALARINGVLRRGGYTSLPRLAPDGGDRPERGSDDALDDEDELAVETTVFSGHGLRVVSRQESYSESAAIAITRDGSELVLAAREDDGSPHAVFAAPDRSFAVILRNYCACECASWAEVWPLDSRSQDRR
jgi:hypothetical protein